MQNYYKQFETCREHDVPACTDACPFKLDFLTVQERITKKRFDAAYKSIRDSVVFPAIVAELCPAYCEKICVRCSVDSPVQIRLLEKSVIAHAKRKTPNSYNLPARKKRIAVIGAGLSGMGFAFKTASRKYDVSVFEKEDAIGGSLSELMPYSDYMAEFDLQFKNEKYTLNLNSEITDINALCEEGFDVIYIATGKNGNSFGLSLEDGSALIGETAVFFGGELCGSDLMHGLADGIAAAAAAENFLKTGRLEYSPAPSLTNQSGEYSFNKDLLKPIPAAPTSDGILTDADCLAEAGRCIRCSCDACSVHCDIVDYFDKIPTKMRDEIFLSCKPAGSLVHKSPARKYVAACTMCDLMQEVCPEHIDLCGMVKYARHKMHEADKVPGAYRQYFMRDMEFANGENAAIRKFAPGFEGKATYAFFPGCNLGALDEAYVSEPYKWLLSKLPDTALLLRCCGVPADWNGEEQRHNEEIASLKHDWEELGKPIMIMACMSCMKHLNEYLPEIETVSLYEIMASSEIDIDCKAQLPSETGTTSFAVFDPCSARNKTDVQKAVRQLAEDCGIATTELPKGDIHGCCGFGGMGSIAAPDFAEFVASRRAELSESPYIVYCSNCRDIFCDRGKKAVHILDLLFNIDADNTRPQPNLTQRRINRTMLKNSLMKEVWEETPDGKSYESRFKLFIPDELQDKINRQKILEEDICEVIAHSEENGRRTLNPDNGHYKAYKEIGHITCWVEYTPVDGGYELHNVYTHRMKIELEAVFNGRKIDV